MFEGVTCVRGEVCEEMRRVRKVHIPHLQNHCYRFAKH